MIGATNPLASPPGTIRGDYGVEVGRNIIHGSDSTEVQPFPSSAGGSMHIRPSGMLSGLPVQMGVERHSCVQSAQAEIALWFQPEELAEYKQSLESWIYG